MPDQASRQLGEFWHPVARWYLDMSVRWSLGTDGVLTP